MKREGGGKKGEKTRLTEAKKTEWDERHIETGTDDSFHFCLQPSVQSAHSYSCFIEQKVKLTRQNEPSTPANQ